MAHRMQIVLDCADPVALTPFWAAALDYVPEPPPDGFDTWEAALDSWGVPAEARGAYGAVVDPDGVGPRLFLQRVAEPKTTKNRMHIDVHLSGPEAGDRQARWAAVLAHVERLEALGARRVAEHDELGTHWMVCLDPEGNEFDVA